ncbi:MAG TPA: DUF2177 family protein [Candidatus Nanoarchaeia archaeon]|nr:DUF2177 family protein [Candidatus Nanoarchaeia archaeon]
MEIKIFLIALISIIILDAIFLGILMKNFYKTELKSIATFKSGSMQTRLVPIILTYLILALGFTFFVSPMLYASLYKSFLIGALFGLVVYGVYDFTNYAIFQTYTLRVAIVDIVWGVFLNGIVAMIASRFI